MLYPELWLMVAEHLEIDKSSISKLVAVNKTTYDLLIPVLYATVTLFDEGSISLFHESMSLPSSSRRSNLVKDLWVVPGYTTPSRQIISIVPPVRFTLGTLKSLEKLTLTPTIVFESLFIDLKCSFRLTHLTCACYPDDHFAGFLQQQTSITNLDLRRIERAHWGGRATVGLANHYNRRLASQLPFLPHLTSITGDSVALKLLCAGRPISRVVITELLNTHGDALAVSIAQSTTPVCSIAIQVDTWREWQGTVLQLLRPLKSTHIASTVIDLRILFDAVGHLYANPIMRIEAYMTYFSEICNDASARKCCVRCV